MTTDDTELPLTGTLVERALALRREQVPTDVAQIAQQCLLDFFAVTLAGHAEALPRLMVEDLRADACGDGATLIGSGERLGARQAALVNGCAGHALDFDDVNLYINGHPSVVLLPALLALGEQLDSGGAELFMAFIAGYEFSCRAGVAMAPGHYLRGYHATASVGVVGTAVACARLLGLDALRTRHAVGIAATQAAGLKSMFGTPCKPLHAGLAAHNGLQSALWAARGLTSRTDALECTQGLARTLSPDFHPQRALADRDRFYLHDNLFKYHAACYGTHSAIECALSLRRDHDLTPADIAGLVIRVEKGADATCNIARPHTAAEAKFSLRFATALALAGHDTGNLDCYGERTLQQAQIAELCERSRVELMTGWTLMDSEVEVHCHDGRELRTRIDTGQPCTDIAVQGERLARKFTTLSATTLGEPGSRALADALASFETLQVRDLMRLCHAGGVH